VKKGQRWPAHYPRTQMRELIDYFLVFFLAVFFFAIETSFSPDIGESEICLEPMIGRSSFPADTRDLFASQSFVREMFYAFPQVCPNTRNQFLKHNFSISGSS
jgi:hypothetical protein